MKQQVKSDTFQEEDDQQSEEEEQAALPSWYLYNLKSSLNPEHPIPPTYHETPDDDDDYDYDYEQLKDEYLELLEEVKSQPMKERKKLFMLKNEKKLKTVVKPLAKIIEKTSTDNMDLTAINQMQYTAALLITSKITTTKTNNKQEAKRWTTSLATKTPETNKPTKRRHIHHH